MTEIISDLLTIETNSMDLPISFFNKSDNEFLEIEIEISIYTNFASMSYFARFLAILWSYINKLNINNFYLSNKYVFNNLYIANLLTSDLKLLSEIAEIIQII